MQHSLSLHILKTTECYCNKHGIYTSYTHQLPTGALYITECPGAECVSKRLRKEHAIAVKAYMQERGYKYDAHSRQWVNPNPEDVEQPASSRAVGLSTFLTRKKA